MSIISPVGILLPLGPQILTPGPFSIVPTPISPGVPFCTSKRPFTPGLGCRYAVTDYFIGLATSKQPTFLGFINAQFQGIQLSIRKPVIGHKHYRQQTPLRGVLAMHGFKWPLLGTPLARDGDDQRRLVNSWESRGWSESH